MPTQSHKVRLQSMPFAWLQVFVTASCDQEATVEAKLKGLYKMSCLFGYEYVMDKIVVQFDVREPCSRPDCPRAQMHRLRLEAFVSDRYTVGLSLGKVGGSLILTEFDSVGESFTLETPCECCPSPPPSQAISTDTAAMVGATNIALVAGLIAGAIWAPLPLAMVLAAGAVVSGAATLYVFMQRSNHRNRSSRPPAIPIGT